MIKSRRDERYYGSSFEKRDPRLDRARAKAALDAPGIEDRGSLLRDIDRDSARNPVDDYGVDRNPVPNPQPGRKDIPADRKQYTDDQANMGLRMRDMLNDDNLLDYLAKGPYGHIDPEIIPQVLDQIRRYFDINYGVAYGGDRKTTKELTHSSDAYLSAKEQQDMIQDKDPEMDDEDYEDREPEE